MSGPPTCIVILDVPNELEEKRNLSPVQVYYYSWGDEDIIGAEIRITKVGNIYTIRTTQHVFDSKHLFTVEVFGTVKDRRVSAEGGNITDEDMTSIIKTEVITVEHLLNPRPEQLFRIIT